MVMADLGRWWPAAPDWSSPGTWMDLAAWAGVVLLVVGHLRAERDPLHRQSDAYRVASAVAAVLVIASAALAGVWPAAALGVLWLRAEALGHRERLPELLDDRPPPGWGSRALRTLRRVWRPVLVVMLRVEIVVLVVLGLVLMGMWMQARGRTFDTNSDRTLCRISNGC